jgi:hypothetical protein
MPNIATYKYTKIGKGSYITSEFSIPVNFGGSLVQNNCFFGLKLLYRKFDIDDTKLLFEFTNTGNLNIN